ncbi:MAG: hypothetical protein AAF664_24815, partial [Planctomycetota bacterium]
SEVLEIRLDLARHLLFDQNQRRLREELAELVPLLNDRGLEDLRVEALILAGSIQNAGSRDESLKAAKMALEGSRVHHGEDHWITLAQQARVAAQIVGRSSQDDASTEAAPLELSEQALDQLKMKWPTHHFEIARAHSQLARVLASLGLWGRCEASCRSAISVFERQMGEASVYAMRDRVRLAQALRELEHPVESRAEALAVARIADVSSRDFGQLSATGFNVLVDLLHESDRELTASIAKVFVDAKMEARGMNPSTRSWLRRQFRVNRNAARVEVAEVFRDAVISFEMPENLGL